MPSRFSSFSSSLHSVGFRRFSDERKFDGNPANSRDTQNGEINSLLERYGVRKPSVTKSPPQSSFEQRRQQQLVTDSGLSKTRRETESAGVGSMVVGGSNLFGTGVCSSSSRVPDRKNVSSTTKDTQEIDHNEFMNRLLVAHNRVDDLLRSRGLSAEDESKYLRAWTEIPIVRARYCRRARTPSTSSSDSGLSTDNGSERSSSIANKKEDITCEHQFVRPETCLSCSKTFHSYQPCSKAYLSCREHRDKSTTAVSPLEEGPVFKATSKVLAAGPLRDKPVEFACVFYAHETSSSSFFLKSREEYQEVKKSLHSSIKAEKQIRVQASSVGLHPANTQKRICNFQKDQPPVDQTKEQGKDASTKPVPIMTIIEQQRAVLANLERKPCSILPCSADISIQHCSFYKGSVRAVGKPERNVRMNLRLTERAPNKCLTKISLPTTPRSLYAYLRVPQKPPTVNRKKNVHVVKRGFKVGKLDLSSILGSTKKTKQQKKVNRLVIPEFLLSGDAIEDPKNDRKQMREVGATKGNSVGVEPNGASLPKRSSIRLA
ncbi:hypothetical protein V3C99_001874 [Haemonchus contortus]